jgi:hypothetical protein
MKLEINLSEHTDRDIILLHACFQILEDFVNLETGHFYEDVYALYVKDFGEDSARLEEKEWDELRILYIWWQTRKSSDYDVFDDKEYLIDSEMLKRLIDIRYLLWI